MTDAVGQEAPRDHTRPARGSRHLAESLRRLAYDAVSAAPVESLEFVSERKAVAAEVVEAFLPEVNAAYERGVAEGRRQATETFIAECQAAATDHRSRYRPGPPPSPPGTVDDRPRDRRSLHVAIGLEQARDIARRRLLADGPWEPAAQVQTPDPGGPSSACPTCGDPYLGGPGCYADQCANDDDAHMTAMEERHQHEAEQDGDGRGQG